MGKYYVVLFLKYSQDILEGNKINMWTDQECMYYALKC